MPRFLLSLLFPFLAIVPLAAQPPAPSIPFRVPPGFIAQKIAGPPLVDHPVFACFDDRGRLYVADNAGMNLKAEDLLKTLPNCIRLLEDTKGTGIFDRSTVFVDKLSMPMGVLWHNGAVYSCSPPSLWKFEDTTGKGVADKRTELVTKFGFTGNAADIHGPFLGPDGLLYWTDGRHGHEIRTNAGLMKGKAARIFRCKPDGTNVEVVCGGGMDDPVEMAFTEEGEPFAVVDIFQAQPTRMDALIYCIDGGVFPYYESVLGEFKRTGPLLPAVSELGWVAPSGLTRYRSTAFGKEYTDNLFSTQFNTHKVVRHILERDGAGFKSRDEDFATSDNPDFHPTCVREDADGSLIVIDTGGWFRIGCPTSVVAKPEIKGGIYRIRKVGAPKIDDPYGKRILWDVTLAENLIELLDDPRPVVRDRAIEALAKRGDAVTKPTLRKAAYNGKTARKRRNAIWTLSRIGSDAALEQLADCEQDDPSVLQTVVRACGIHRIPGPFEIAIRTGNAAVRREAATAIGRFADPGYARPLLKAIEMNHNDRFLDHALINALIGIANKGQKGLRMFPDSSANVLRAALITLDQIDKSELTSDQVLPHLSAENKALRQTAWDVVLRRSDWLSDASKEIRNNLMLPNLPEERRIQLQESLALAGRVPAIQSLVADLLNDAKTPVESRMLLLDVIATAPVEKLPPAWTATLRTNVTGGKNAVIRQAIHVIASLGLSEFDADLNALVANPMKPVDLRVAALSVTAPRLKVVSADSFDLLLSQLQLGLTSERSAAAQALGRSPLSPEQLTALCDILPKVTALELPRLLPAFERGGSVDLGRKLVAALEKSPAFASLSPQAVRDAFKAFPDEIRTAASPLVRKLTVDDTAQRKRLAELADVWKTGDATRGKAVFFSKKSACMACHTVGGVGERVGPDLSKIGQIRTEADLLESILFPSNSIVRGYETFVIHEANGKTHTGLIRRETADAIYLMTPERTEIRLPRRQIESLEPSRVSIMPQGLDGQLTRNELGDLIAFLKSLK